VNVFAEVLPEVLSEPTDSVVLPKIVLVHGLGEVVSHSRVQVLLFDNPIVNGFVCDPGHLVVHVGLSVVVAVDEVDRRKPAVVESHREGLVVSGLNEAEQNSFIGGIKVTHREVCDCLLHSHADPLAFVSVERGHNYEVTDVLALEALLGVVDVVLVLFNTQVGHVAHGLVEEPGSVVEGLEVFAHKLLVVRVPLVLDPLLPGQPPFALGSFSRDLGLFFASFSELLHFLGNLLSICDRKNCK